MLDGAATPIPKRPVLRYHGGKWRLAPWIIAQFPPHRVYVEPFGGGASVLLRKPRSYAEVYNDIWGEIVGVFRVLRDPDTAAALRLAVELTPFARDEFEATRPSVAGTTQDPVERARRIIFRSMAGFGSAAARGNYNTGFRANSNRSGTTPARDWLNYPDAIAGFTERLRGVVIENRDALRVIKAHDGPETLHYCDPPYLHETRCHRARNEGYEHEMTDDDHRELAAALMDVKGAVVLSGYRSPLYDEMLAGWRRIERVARADGARERTECLWLNAAAERGQGLFAEAR